MKKPTKHENRCYDYHECKEYLQAKYRYDERDYAGKYRDAGLTDDIPYQDFWHFVVETGEVTNGKVFTMSERWMEDATDWQKWILERYFSEFGEPDGSGGRHVRFHVWW